MRRFAAIATMLVTTIPMIAGASPINARLSTSGLRFLQDQVPALVPKHLEPPELTQKMFSCSNGDATVTQRDTKVDLSIDNFALSIPDANVLRIDLTLSVAATGSAYFFHPYACYGEETCNDAVDINGARAIIDFKATIDPAGKPHFEAKNVDLQLTKDQVDVTISDCAEAGVANWAVDVFKNYALDLALTIAEDMAKKQIGPQMEKLVGDFIGYRGDIGIAQFAALVNGLDMTAAQGITIHGDVDISSRFPAAACVSHDPGEPAAASGPAPDLGNDSHVGIEVNLGLLQDAMYHVWHEGFLCITPDTLKSFGVNLDSLNLIGNMLPGFPANTKFSVDVTFAQPPTVQGVAANAGTLTVHLNGVGANLIAKLPDNTQRRLHLDVDASVTASVQIDPTVNALVLQIEGLKIDHMGVDDQLGLTALGFDFARVQQLLETVVLPQVMAQVGQVPVTGPVFGGMQGMYVILKGFQTTDSWLAVKADLFHAPDHDVNAPTTSIDQKPSKVVRPIDAKLIFGGTDREIPTSLLKYRVTVDGKQNAEPGFVRTIKVGEVGKTATYHVVVKAIDLAGNEDPTGATADVLVDGVLPTMTVTTQLRGAVSELAPTIEWSAGDDHSAPEKITARFEVTELDQSNGVTTERQVGMQRFPAGTTSAPVEGLEAGKQYKLVVVAIDEAGNEAAQTFIFAVTTDAGAAGGCSLAGHGSAPLAPFALILGFVLVAVRRRR